MLDATERHRLSGLYEQLRLKLLDLSKKNRMLNYSLGAKSKRHLQIIDEVLEEVYKKLVGQEASLRILALDDPEDIPREEKTEDFIAAFEHAKISDIEYLTKLEALESQGRDDEITLARLERELRDKVRSQLGLPPKPKKTEINRAEHARSLGIDPNPELQSKVFKASHSDDALQTLKFRDELERVLDKISSDARLSEQEMGLSTLFLAFGFLEWYESDASDKKTFAPLLLLPVRLEAKKVRGQEVFYVSAREESAEINLSLQKLLESNFNRKLPGFENGDEEQPASVEAYLAHVQEAIRGLTRWQVHRWLVLGHFAFGRYAMYADLNPENWKKHPVEYDLVSSILHGSETKDGESLPPDDYPIDEPEIEEVAPLLIQDADASQHSALIDVMKEKNLVIQGPPGTGKSQTITNIIANALAADKKVLFLAEKQAALEVVKRRLTRSGLDEFCLELHSDKSSPKLIVESLKQRIDLGLKGTKKSNQPANIAWYESRKEIKAYLDALHAEQPDGLTPFQLIWRARRGRTANAEIIDQFDSVTLPDRLLADSHEREKADSNLTILADASVNFMKSYGRRPAASPWAHTKVADLAGHQVSHLANTLKQLQNVGAALAAFIENASHFGVTSVEDVTRLVQVDRALDDPPPTRLLPQVAKLDVNELEKVLTCIAEWHRVSRTLGERPDLSKENVAKLTIASALAQSALPAEWLQYTPADAYERATAMIRRNTAIIELVERFLPIVRFFDFDRHLSASGILPLALAVKAGARVAPEHRRWVNAHGGLDLSEFWKLKKRWSAIAANESKWRSHLRQYGTQPWPGAEAIETAAITLRKAGIRKVFAALNGTTKAARALVEQLGLAAFSDKAEQLERLAAHVRSVREFELDEAAAALLGSSWSGLSTPFNEIGIGIKIRELFLNQIGNRPHGREVAERLISLVPELYGALADHVPTAEAFCNAPDEIRQHFDDRPIEQLLATCRKEIEAMQRVLALDPPRVLADIPLAIQDIAEIFALMTQRDSLQRQIDASPIKNAISSFGQSAEMVDEAISAAKWAREVHRSNPPYSLHIALMSMRAAATRVSLRQAAKQAAELIDRYSTLRSHLENDFGFSSLAAFAPKELVAKVTDLISHAGELSDFLAIRRSRAALADAGLGPFLDRADDLKLAPEKLREVLATIIADRRAAGICSATVFVRNSGAMLDAHRRQFAILDRKKIESDRAAIRAKLLQKQPLRGSNDGPKKKWTEMALLHNELAKQKRFTPVRSLVARAGRSIQELKPCFMMSPLSLAKFIPPNSLPFDILVIDEASQMKPEDALGGLLRAKQIVVVGDQKQLPPTDFFNRSSEATDDDDFQDIDDESILEACLKTFREVRRLKWHYRSRCESLIRFSNENFYSSNLITFPAAKTGSFSIDFVRVDGMYQARRNVAEAIRVAEEAVKFMRHYADRDDATIPTLGIVALNIEQRDLIQEELRRVSADDVRVEQFQEKVARKGEPVFVKNLENVQGDERDFIFISLTYGREPGATGMRQRFGPINSKHGHRRLNVLFTRARMRIGLFASFGSNDVRPTETSAEGVHVLKRYLEYAEGQGRAVVERIGGEADSDFEIEVADRLRAKGYQAELQVGVSGYRIDVGVRHPDYPEQFLAGVECDGARYHASKSARDRDRLREEVLNGLGWNLIRVWSTDWFGNPTGETEKLIRRLEELRSAAPVAHDDYPSLVMAFESPGADSVTERGTELDGEAGEVNEPEASSLTEEMSPLRQRNTEPATTVPSRNASEARLTMRSQSELPLNFAKT